MADKKITDLTAASAAALANVFEIDEAGTSKKLTLQQMVDLQYAMGQQRVKGLTSQFLATANSIAMTNVSGLDMTLAAGKYNFIYTIHWKSNDATNGIRINVNYTGTSGAFLYQWRWVDTSATASTAVPDQDAVGAAGQVVGAMARRAKATTGAGGVLLSADTVNADMLLICEGYFVATGSGDLELWAGNEAAGVGDQISIEVGSNVVVTQVA